MIIKKNSNDLIYFYDRDISFLVNPKSLFLPKKKDKEMK